MSFRLSLRFTFTVPGALAGRVKPSAISPQLFAELSPVASFASPALLFAHSSGLFAVLCFVCRLFFRCMHPPCLSVTHSSSPLLRTRLSPTRLICLARPACCPLVWTFAVLSSFAIPPHSYCLAWPAIFACSLLALAEILRCLCPRPALVKTISYPMGYPKMVCWPP